MKSERTVLDNVKVADRIQRVPHAAPRRQPEPHMKTEDNDLAQREELARLTCAAEPEVAELAVRLRAAFYQCLPISMEYVLPAERARWMRVARTALRAGGAE